MKNIKLKITLLLFLAPFYSYSCLADLGGRLEASNSRKNVCFTSSTSKQGTK